MATRQTGFAMLAANSDQQLWTWPGIAQPRRIEARVPSGISSTASALP
jgi:hypothetical protein